MKIAAVIALLALTYAVGYNSGANVGYDNAIKYAPECRNGK